MTKFDLNYNPFTKEKIFLVDDKPDKFEECWGISNKELSEWSDKFFEKLYKKYNDSKMSVKFKGILRDYEFLKDAKKRYEAHNSSVHIELIDNGCSNSNQKLGELKKLFKQMQKETPFEQLKSKALEDLFNKVISSEFEMAVVATISSGKSTLINALLGQELLPARNKATTATLARIHDVDAADHFSGKSYDKNYNELASIDPLLLSNMNELNDNPETSTIEIYGDIIGIKSNDLRLVLTDTPGPNNSRTEEHKEHTYSLLQADYKPMILYVLNSTQLETNDDNSLLNDVAKAMNAGGRQAQERFIFVLNKADEFDPAKGENVSKIIEDVKAYLEKHNIHNARVFPSAARMAKVIRQHQNNRPLSQTEEDEILPCYNTFIKREWKHFSDFAPLSPATKKIQDEMIASAKENNDVYQEALIYTGIPAIELAISEYLTKYALPAKITEGVYSFKEKIDNLGIEAEEKEKLKGNQKEVEKLVENLNKIVKDIQRGNKATVLREKIKNLSVEKPLQQIFEKMRSDLMDQFIWTTRFMINSHLNRNEAEDQVDKLKRSMDDLGRRFHIDMQSELNNVMEKLANEAVDEYKKYLEDLIPYKAPEAIIGDLKSNLSFETSLEMYSKLEYVKNGTRRVPNENKKWYKPWTWFDPSYIEVPNPPVRKEFVNFSEYLEREIQPELENFVTTTRKKALNWAIKAENDLKNFFENQFDKMNKEIQEKSSKEQEIISKKESFEKMIEENEKRLRWIKNFKKDLDSLLAI